MRMLNKIILSASIFGIIGCSQSDIHYPVLISQSLIEPNVICSDYLSDEKFEIDKISNIKVCQIYSMRNNRIFLSDIIARAYDKNHNKIFELDEWEFFGDSGKEFKKYIEFELKHSEKNM